MAIRRFASLLMVFVMLGSVVSPAMAASNEGVCEKCDCSANLKGVAVLEVKGLEKAFLIADILKNKDVKKLRNALNIDKMDLANAKAVKIIDNRGIAKTVVIPLKTRSGEIKLVYISAKGYVKVGAVEVVKEGEIKQIRVYYVNGDDVKRYTIKSFSECNNCVWSCTFQCIAQDCAPYTPGVCSLCHPLLECCLPAPIPDNPCCAGAIICYGAIATGCHLWCIYDCNQRGECP